MQLTAYLEATARIAMFAVGRYRRAPDQGAKQAKPPAAEGALTGPASINTLEGDTLWKLAERHGVSPYHLMAANPGFVAFDHLEPGQQLSLPQADATRTPVLALDHGEQRGADQAQDPTPARASDKPASDKRQTHKRHLGGVALMRSARPMAA